ncbi:MAG: fibronectin type III domain-containing protein [archaeon]|nr:fibronectin type III domain-containing protein [archaeon]
MISAKNPLKMFILISLFFALFVSFAIANEGNESGSDVNDPPQIPPQEPLTAPTNLRATFVSQNELGMNWDFVGDEDFSHFEIYLNDSLMGMPTSASFSFTGLQNDTIYSVKVRAVDTAERTSEFVSSNEKTEAAYVAPPQQPQQQAPSNENSESQTTPQEQTATEAPEPETAQTEIPVVEQTPAVEPAAEQTAVVTPVEQTTSVTEATQAVDETTEPTASQTPTGFFLLQFPYNYGLLIIGLIALIAGWSIRQNRLK